MSGLNPQIVSWNKANRVRQEIKAKKFKQAMKRNDVPPLAYHRQRRRFALDTSTYATFRLAPPYEAEVNEILDDLSILPLYRRQKTGAQGPRLKVGYYDYEQQPWIQFLKGLIQQQIVADARPREMWEYLYSRLDSLGCQPREFTDPQSGEKCITFKVVCSGGQAGDHVLSYRTFLNQISLQRRTKI